MRNSSYIIKATVGTDIQNFGFVNVAIEYPKNFKSYPAYVSSDFMSRVMNDLKKSKQTLEGTNIRYCVPLYYSTIAEYKERWM